jgi:hypothetical protein
MVRECSEVASNISVVSTETIEYIMIIIGMYSSDSIKHWSDSGASSAKLDWCFFGNEDASASVSSQVRCAAARFIAWAAAIIAFLKKMFADPDDRELIMQNPPSFLSARARDMKNGGRRQR